MASFFHIILNSHYELVHIMNLLNIRLCMKEKYIKTDNGVVFVCCSEKFLNNKTIVWLHGWGMNCESFLRFEKEFRTFNHLFIDSLGFGKSDEPSIELTLKDYVEILKEIIESFNLNDVIIVGHSFGGRVAILYSSLYKVDKLILVSAKAFKNRSIKYRFKIYKYKIKKLFFRFINKKKYLELINNSGSIDYQNASLVMKQTMKNIVNYDLEKALKDVKCDCVVLGSINDTEVKYNETLKIYSLLENSKLYPFYNSNHFLHLEEKDKFINILKKELE